MYLRDHLLSCLESARTATNTTQRRSALTLVVVSGGYAGVELTAQMSRLTANLLPLYRTVREGDVRWLLVDVASSVMPELGQPVTGVPGRVPPNSGIFRGLPRSIHQRDHDCHQALAA